MPENPYLRDDGSDVLSDAWDDGYAAGYAAAKPPGYVVQTQAEVDRLLNEAEALRIERDAAREDLAACRQFAADHVERAARQNIVARVAYAEGKADAVALIRERAANALPEVARFMLDEIEAIVALAVPPSGAATEPPADFWREVPCGHPTDPVAWAGPDGYVCHCGRLLDGKQGQHVPEAPGPVVLCSKCGCHVACPPSGAEAGEGCRAPHCWSEYGTPCGTCPAGAEAGGDA